MWHFLAFQWLLSKDKYQLVAVLSSKCLAQTPRGYTGAKKVRPCNYQFQVQESQGPVPGVILDRHSGAEVIKRLGGGGASWQGKASEVRRVGETDRESYTGET